MTTPPQRGTFPTPGQVGVQSVVMAQNITHALCSQVLKCILEINLNEIEQLI